MATISENLQIIKNSTDAIKQAIIDKGGSIEGDITTWADAISGISSGGSSSEEEYVFAGTISYGETTVTVTGNLNKVPDGRNYLLVLGRAVAPVFCYTDRLILNTGPYILTIDFGEMINYPIPAICIVHIDGDNHTVIPVKFVQKPGSGGSDN